MRLPLYFGIAAFWVSTLPAAARAQAADSASARHQAADTHHTVKKTAKKKTAKKKTATTKKAADSTGAGASAGAAAKPEGQSDDYVSYDASTNTTKFKLVAGPFVFDGYGAGQAALVVPSKSHVTINFVNDDGTPHSAIVIDDKDPMPSSDGEPAIPRAFTRKVTEGLPQGAKDVISFTAPDSGSYRIFCGVPGHGLSGMWIRMRVDPAAKTARFEAPKKGA